MRVEFYGVPEWIMAVVFLDKKAGDEQSIRDLFAEHGLGDKIRSIEPCSPHGLSVRTLRLVTSGQLQFLKELP